MTALPFSKTRLLSPAQQQAALALWNAEYPAGLQYGSLAELEAYLAGLEDVWYYLYPATDTPLAWGFTFLRNGERWFALLLHRSIQGRGIGSQLLAAFKADNAALCGWATDVAHFRKADGSPYLSPLDFYRKNGFSILTEIRLQTDVLSAVKVVWPVEL